MAWLLFVVGCEVDDDVELAGRCSIDKALLLSGNLAFDVLLVLTEISFYTPRARLRFCQYLEVHDFMCLVYNFEFVVG